jgi:hypothetical protein
MRTETSANGGSQSDRRGLNGAMSTLILTPDDAAAGCLAASEIADRVIQFDYRLVSGPVPAVSDPEVFFAERAKLGGPEIERWDTDGPVRLCNEWREVIRLVNDFDQVEIWADHDPNSQVQLLQLLDWFSAYPGLIAKLSLRSPDFLIRGRTPESISALELPAENIADIHLQTARVALRAFQQPSPEAWFGLLHDDLQALPFLQATVGRLLEELPAVDTALTATDMSLLEIISTGPIPPMRAIATYCANTPVSVLDYWASGRGSTGSPIARHPRSWGSTRGRSTWPCTTMARASSATSAAACRCPNSGNCC